MKSILSFLTVLGVSILSQFALANDIEVGLPKIFNQNDKGAIEAKLVRLGPAEENFYLFIFENMDHKFNEKPLLVKAQRQGANSDLTIYGVVGSDESMAVWESGSRITMKGFGSEEEVLWRTKTKPTLEMAKEVLKSYQTNNGLTEDSSKVDTAKKATAEGYASAKKSCGLKADFSIDWSSFEKSNSTGAAMMSSGIMQAIRDLCSDSDFKEALGKLKKISVSSSGKLAGTEVGLAGHELVVKFGKFPGMVTADVKYVLKEKL